MDNAWVTRLLQVFGPLLAAWSAFLAFLVHLKKLRNSEKAAAHGRIMEELETLYEALKVEREENVACRDKIAFLEADKAKLMQENATMKGYSDGIGEARNEAQRMLSEEREKDAKLRRGPGNGGGARADDGDGK